MTMPTTPFDPAKAADGNKQGGTRRIPEVVHDVGIRKDYRLHDDGKRVIAISVRRSNGVDDERENRKKNRTNIWNNQQALIEAYVDVVTKCRGMGKHATRMEGVCANGLKGNESRNQITSPISTQ